MKKAIITIIIIAIALLITNVYAIETVNENMFFIIKKIFTEKEIVGKENLLSDREITISYSNIEITEGIKIQIQKILLEEKTAKLYVYVQNEKSSKNKLIYKIFDDNNNLICDYMNPKNNKEMNYIEELKIGQNIKENAKITLKILDENQNVLSTITIDFANKELLVNGNEIINKQSEAELKQYLGAFAILNDSDYEYKTDKLIYIAELINNDVMKKQEYSRKLKNNTIEAFYNEKIETVNEIITLDKNSIYNYIKYIDDYQQKSDPGIRKKGICFDINDISYKDGIYTVKFIYCLSNYNNDEYEEGAENLLKYKATAQLSINKNSEYSKYKLISLSNGEKIN